MSNITTLSSTDELGGRYTHKIPKLCVFEIGKLREIALILELQRCDVSTGMVVAVRESLTRIRTPPPLHVPLKRSRRKQTNWKDKKRSLGYYS